MKYPKGLMSISELTKLGFSKTDLYQAAHHYLSYKYIQVTKGGGKLLFDTEQWEKYRRSVLHRG